jgi:hypothetical protein
MITSKAHINEIFDRFKEAYKIANDNHMGCEFKEVDLMLGAKKLRDIGRILNLFSDYDANFTVDTNYHHPLGKFKINFGISSSENSDIYETVCLCFLIFTFHPDDNIIIIKVHENGIYDKFQTFTINCNDDKQIQTNTFYQAIATGYKLNNDMPNPKIIQMINSQRANIAYSMHFAEVEMLNNAHQ